MKTKVILVGGFLGAGKTTLLWRAARALTESGSRVGLITNDQASELVDTAFLERAGSMVGEVSGSCFCCNFNGFTGAVMDIRAKQAGAVIAEPVGSCTDLSATIMQPLKQKFSEELDLAPLTVLVDPERLRDILGGGNAGLHASAAYIVRKQLEEADVIVVNKSDLLSAEAKQELLARAAAAFPLAKLFALSAKTGEGVEEWLAAATGDLAAGTHLTEVDYDIYAEGEAVLGWLNKTYRLYGMSVEWDSFAEMLLQELGRRFAAEHAAVGHVKLLVEAGKRQLVGNLTGGLETLSLRGSAGIGSEVRLMINARVETTPEELEQMVSQAVEQVCGERIVQTVVVSNCLCPGRPNPTYRYDSVAMA